MQYTSQHPILPILLSSTHKRLIRNFINFIFDMCPLKRKQILGLERWYLVWTLNSQERTLSSAGHRAKIKERKGRRKSKWKGRRKKGKGRKRRGKEERQSKLFSSSIFTFLFICCGKSLLRFKYFIRIFCILFAHKFCL